MINAQLWKPRSQKLALINLIKEIEILSLKVILRESLHSKKGN